MASKAELALILSLVDDVSKTAKGVGKELTSVGKIGQGLQGTMVSLGKVGFAAVAAGAAIAVASVTALGAASWKAARKLDDAFDAIEIGTRAAGAELEGLKDDFRTVFADFPGEASVVAGVLSEVNTRLGLTGEAAQDLTLNIAQAARMMGGDAVAQTQKFARVMGDWDITTDDATNTLDKFFVMSQATGAGMEDLMAKVVQFGAPMRLMGFTLEDSIALFGKWEKEGVNAELVMGSLRIAAGKFAKEGKPLRESLLATFDAIQKTDDASWALQHGMEIFGARAGPDMVAAIREGRFAFEDLLETMGDVDGAILATAAATEDWGEKWQRIKNRITLALEPIGMAMMNVAGQVLDALMPAFEKIGPLIDTHIMPAVNRISQAFDVFFRGLEMWQSPLEAFKDVLWTLLPPQMASQIIGVIDWLGTLVGAIKGGDWEAAGGMIWEQIQIGISKAIAGGKGLLELLRQELASAFTSSEPMIDTSTGQWIERDATWGDIGRAIGRNILQAMGEALAAVPVYLLEWATTFETFINSEQFAAIIRTIGGAVGRFVGAGIREFLDLDTTSDELSSSLIGMVARAVVKAASSIRQIAAMIGMEIGIGIQEGLTGKTVTQEERAGLSGLMDQILRAIDQIRLLKTGPRIPGFASGTPYFGGGLALVGEKGPELVHLPRGSAVYDNERTQRMTSETSYNITVHIAGNASADDVEIGVLRGLRSAGVAV